MFRSISAAFLLAVGARATVLEDTIATVNGQPILMSEYEKEVQAAVEGFKRIAPGMLSEKEGVGQLRRKVLDQMVDNLLLQQEGERRKIKIHEREIDQGVAELKEKNFRRDEEGKLLTDPELDAALARELKKEGLTESQFRERIRKQLMMRKVIEELVRPKVKAAEEADVRKAFERVQFVVKGDTAPLAGLPHEVAQAYQGLGQQLKSRVAERVRVSHIMVKLPPKPSMVDKTQALGRIKDLKKRLDAGEDFEELAKKHSEDEESKARGGDLGPVVRGMLPPEFEKAAFATAVGEISEAVETPMGYHLLFVHEKKAAEKITFEKLKDDLGQFLYNIGFQDELEKLVKSLQAQAHVDIRMPKKDEAAKDN